MNTFTRILLIGGGGLLVVWVVVACLLGCQGFFTHRRWERNPKRWAVYRRFGKEPPAPAGRWRLAWTMVTFAPMLLMFSLLFILWHVVTVPCVIYCLITGKSSGGTMPGPPLPPDQKP
jgi:hypothetical protein